MIMEALTQHMYIGSYVYKVRANKTEAQKKVTIAKKSFIQITCTCSIFSFIEKPSYRFPRILRNLISQILQILNKLCLCISPNLMSLSHKL